MELKPTAKVAEAIALAQRAAQSDGHAEVTPAHLVSALVRLDTPQVDALVTAAGLMAPAVEAAGYSAGQIAAITVATAAGSVFASHVNDSGFWLVGRLLNMDVATTLRTWTVQQTLESVIGFVMAGALFLIL